MNVPVDDLVVRRMGYPPRDAGVNPDEDQGRKAPQNVFHLVDVLGGAFVGAIIDAAAVMMHEDRQGLFLREGVDGIEPAMMDGGHLAAHHHVRQVVVPAHDLSNRTPHPWELLMHALDMRDGAKVCGVECGEARRKALPVLIGQREPRVGNHLVRIGVHVARAVVVLVAVCAWCVCGVCA